MSVILYYINTYPVIRYHTRRCRVDKPVDLEAVERITAKLERVLEEYPELQEHNPERQQALEEWLAALEQGGQEHDV